MCTKKKADIEISIELLTCLFFKCGSKKRKAFSCIIINNLVALLVNSIPYWTYKLLNSSSEYELYFPLHNHIFFKNTRIY